MKPLIIAAPSSGCGKTSVTLGLLAAFKRRGLAVAPFKVGPDYIDPGLHALACDRPSRNLDGWMCGKDYVRKTFATGSAGADLAVAEGVMGLFDGASATSDSGSTAEIARWLDGRVVLVVDARAQARSAAVLVQGFTRFDPRLDFAGIIFNRVGSAGHEAILRDAVASIEGLPPVLGCLPRRDDLALPERHLGLVTAEESGLDQDYFGRLADWVEEHLDLSSLAPAVPKLFNGRPQSFSPSGDQQVRLGVARDEAFCFYYPDNLDLLQEAGAELVPFSPLRDAQLPPEIDGLYLGGGYPELFAEQLSKNKGLLRHLRQAVTTGLPTYAECGGFMLLARYIDKWPMAGVFPARARMLEKRKALGYREVTLKAACPLGEAGTRIRGHEFHYSEMEMAEAVPSVYRMERRGGQPAGEEGYLVHNVLGSYVHLHFGSNPQIAQNFVEFCRTKGK